jgi:hypothetical protein
VAAVVAIDQARYDLLLCRARAGGGRAAAAVREIARLLWESRRMDGMDRSRARRLLGGWCEGVHPDAVAEGWALFLAGRRLP